MSAPDPGPAARSPTDPTDPHDARPYRQRGPIRGPVLIATAGVLLALAMTMNWVRAGDAIAWRGIDLSTGSRVFGFGVAAALVVLGCVRRRTSGILAIALAFAVAWRGLLIVRDGVRLAASDQSFTRFDDVRFGPGTWLVFVAAICALAGGILLLVELSRADPGEQA